MPLIGNKPRLEGRNRTSPFGALECMTAGLVKGEGFAVDASVIEAKDTTSAMSASVKNRPYVYIRCPAQKEILRFDVSKR
jgi:hypothetical protein